MKRIVFVGLGLSLLCAGASRRAYGIGAYFTKAPQLTTCNVITSVNGQFSATESRYSISGTCTVFNDLNKPGQESTFDKQVPLYQVSWSAAGTYSTVSKATVEQIVVLNPNNPQQKIAEVQTTMICPQDPWRDSGNAACSSVHSSTSGNPAEILSDDRLPKNVGWLYPDPNRAVPWTSMLPPDRRAALQRQYTDYVQHRGQEIRQATSQHSLASQLASPTILSPTAGQRFYAQTAIPIKLAPPQGWNVTSYLVGVQRKDPSGNWIHVANISIPAAEAQSANGYTRFGAGGVSAAVSGVRSAPATEPGTWHLAAQVSSPKQSGWSNLVEFIVMQPRVTVPAPAGVGKLGK